MAEAQNPWPKVVRTGWIERRAEVNLSRLDAVEKRLVWECFKRSRPRLAELLRDASLQNLCAIFGAEVLIDEDEFKGEKSC